MDFNFSKEKIISIINYDIFKGLIVRNHEAEFFGEIGNTHYKFLSYISTFFTNSTIIDLSTDAGLSAIALAYNKTNSIVSYENGQSCVEAGALNNINTNIIFNTEIQVNDEFIQTHRDELLNSSLIFIDLHPHTGETEYKLYDFLIKNNYQGLIIYDDIWYFKEMRDNLWYKIEEKYKFDITEFSHWSGCGIVSFNKENTQSFKMNKKNVENWTLVTAYFNLTKCSDASDSIKLRDKNYYINHSYSTLSLPYNLVIYCDEESYEEILKIRPKYLNSKTHYNICKFDDLGFIKNGIRCNETFKDYRNKINENRRKFPYNFDNRNTASYYLFCMARYAMLKEVISLNLFNSTHFAWINFCIERMGFKNLIHLEEGLELNRDKFSTCYIDYIPKNLVTNIQEYFSWGRCSMCSGFFTGNFKYMYKVCDLIENKFLEYLAVGYGHADEQLYSPVYFEHPELFEHYYGDYSQMITNYKYIYDAPEPPIYNFISNSYLHKDFAKCLEACIFMKKSLELNKCVLNNEYINILNNYYVATKQIMENGN